MRKGLEKWILVWWECATQSPLIHVTHLFPFSACRSCFFFLDPQETHAPFPTGNSSFVWKVMTIWISWELPCWISSVSICAALESDIRLKSYDHLKFSRASVVQFRASWYIMFPNQTSIWKVMTIWISRELWLFNFEHLDILCS